MSNSNLDDCMDSVIEPPECQDLPLSRSHAEKIDFYNSQTFKILEEARRERSKPSTHVPVDFNRVWCPVYSKVRPEWLCDKECEADDKSVLDEDWSSDE